MILTCKAACLLGVTVEMCAKGYSSARGQPHLHLQRLCQATQSKLGWGVGGVSKQADLAGLGGHKHDAAHSSLLHGGYDGPCRVNAAQVVHFHQFLLETRQVCTCWNEVVHRLVLHKCSYTFHNLNTVAQFLYLL